MQILIAEDEAIIAESLYQVLLELGYHPIEPSSNHTEAIETLQTTTPNLAIVDIHLGEHFSGFKVAEVLNKTNTPFIFLTALYDKETISKAKGFNPLAYLVKPFNKENLFATIELAANQLQNKKGDNNSDKVYLKDGTKTITIVTTDIIYIKVDGKYTFIFLQQNKKFTLRIPLTDLLVQLNFPPIIQVHKSFAVNIQCITQIKYTEVYVNDITIPLGRSFRDFLLNRINRE